MREHCFERLLLFDMIFQGNARAHITRSLRAGGIRTPRHIGLCFILIQWKLISGN